MKSLSSKYKVLIRYTRQEKCQCWLNYTFLHFEHLFVFGAKGARGCCCCCRLFLTQLSRWGFWGSISVGLHSQQSICQATLLIQIIHLPNYTSRFNQRFLNSDRERYFFMKDAGHILRVNVAERRRRKPHPPPPVPQFEPRVRKLFMLDNCIHYC